VLYLATFKVGLGAGLPPTKDQLPELQAASKIAGRMI